jgi:hypothetical protein
MNPYDEVQTTVAVTHPALVYVAIGCSQAYNPPEQRTPQQYPPSIAAWPGPKVIVLIDPTLEAPAHIHELVHAETEAATDVHIIEIRKNFYWQTPSDAAFLVDLCQRAIEDTGPHVIVQDYAGRDIRDILPINIFGPRILDKVLYDMTYADGGCRPDLGAIRILRDAHGNFIQPFYEPLWSLRPRRCPTSLIRAEATDRSSLLTNYVHRLYRIKTGREEFRDWCTDDVVAQRADRLQYIYGIPAPITTVENLRLMLSAALSDFCNVVRNPMTHYEIAAAVDGDYGDIMKTLRIVMDAEFAGDST